ncbi:hypothetical protein BDR04DRAFT_1123613 [Suillus decipiens]|nr:hypothetical protein BDR04DRAFT_1123613 [Suillus decipiens]
MHTVGDIKPGEIVPCDGIFLAGHNVMCATTLKRAGGSLRGEHVSTPTDCFVVSGGKILEGVGSYVVVAVGTKSLNGRIPMAMYVSLLVDIPVKPDSISSQDED